MNKTALVTGASHGIGYEISKLFARNGYNLVLVARNAQRLKEMAGELERVFGINTMVIARDLSVWGAAEEIFAELEWDMVHVDILVNSVGFQEYGPFSKADLQKELQMIQVHITALTCLTKLFLPGMLRQGHGRILNVGSTCPLTPGGPLNAVYCATKAYVLSFSEAIAEELKGTGVTVTTLYPGATNTGFARRADLEDIRLFKFRCGEMEARKVAEAGNRAMMKGERER